MLKENNERIVIIKSSKYGEIKYSNRDNYNKGQIEQAVQCLEATDKDIKNVTGYLDTALKNGWTLQGISIYENPDIRETRERLRKLQESRKDKELHPEKYVSVEQFKELKNMINNIAEKKSISAMERIRIERINKEKKRQRLEIANKFNNGEISEEQAQKNYDSIMVK